MGGGYGLGHGIWKRSADADSEAWEPLDTDTVPDAVLVDMEVTVLVLPAMEATDLDTVSGRDPLMPIPKLGEPLDTDTVPDTVLEDMRLRIRWICLRKVISISPTTCYL